MRERPEPGALLSIREIDVLEVASKGYSRKETAELLGLGWMTVKTHLQNARTKLRVSSTTEAIEAARAQGHIGPWYHGHTTL